MKYVFTYTNSDDAMQEYERCETIYANYLAIAINKFCEQYKHCKIISIDIPWKQAIMCLPDDSCHVISCNRCQIRDDCYVNKTVNGQGNKTDEQE